MNYHIELTNPDEVAKYEDAFAEEMKSRGEDFKYFQDQYGEHPEERAVKNEEVTEKLAEVATLTGIFGSLKEKVLLFGFYSLSLHLDVKTGNANC